MKTIDVPSTAVGVTILIALSSMLNPVARTWAEANYTLPVAGDIAEIVTTLIVCAFALTTTLLLVEMRSLDSDYKKAIISGMLYPVMMLKAIWIVAFTNQKL